MRRPHVLFLGYVWPELTSSAAGLRTWTLIRIFQSAGWQVSFATAAKESEHRAEVEAAGVACFSIRLNDSSFDEWIGQLRPDYVVFERFLTEEQFGWRVRENSPASVRVLDTVDLHALRRERERGLRKEGAMEPIPSADASVSLAGPLSDDWLRELASLRRSDFVFVVSDHERGLLVTRFGIPADRVGVSRFAYPAPPPSLPFEERFGFSMIGNFRHPPNADAFDWTLREIWPRIRKSIPGATLHVYGAYPPKEAMARSDRAKGISVEGWVKDHIAALGRHRVNLAPLRFGAGIKGKISDGWFAGAPAVTTPIGAEGMCEGLPWGGAVAESPEEIAEAAVELYRNRESWQIAVERGRAILHAHYSFDSQARQVLEALTRTQGKLRESRESDWLGAMLWHHSLQSTRYLSKWIEAKEALKAHLDRCESSFTPSLPPT